jgi:hypothetical protein
MINFQTLARLLRARKAWLLAVTVFALAAWGAPPTSANHPVLVEGNCDSPVPGTTIVGTGTCGDYDGDGRIGTAEDTDGADRIFGTLKAALGPGTGAAAGTGANNNGAILIVKSGRFAEQLLIGNTTAEFPDQGTATPGNVLIEAAPGVVAAIDAVFQGDPAGGNTARQAGVGITVNTGTGVRVVLRNLLIRNFQTGVLAMADSRLTVDGCRFDGNRDYGLRAINGSRVAVYRSEFTATGFRIPVSGPSNPGHAISYEGTSGGVVAHSLITGSAGAALVNTSSIGASAVRYYEVITSHNGTGTVVNATREPNP